MRLGITGGGTGGHIYPALEIGRAARDRGADLAYFGSIRGMEGQFAEREQVPFFSVDAQPLWSLRTLAGWKSAVKLLRAVSGAKAHLRSHRPDLLFATGGYSAAPFLQAAKSLRIPIVIHESNSVPGRVNRMFSHQAKNCTYVFRHSQPLFGRNATRTGQPIRKQLRNAPSIKSESELAHKVLVMGGSQGARFVNELVINAAKKLPEVQFILASGPALEQEANAASADVPNVQVHGYLAGDELIKAYQTADVFVGRSGGTLAEVAAFRVPSVLVPLPTSADHHQLYNAVEFERTGASRVLWQGGVSPEGHEMATPDTLTAAILSWTRGARDEASNQLATWDLPDSTERILSFIISP